MQYIHRGHFCTGRELKLKDKCEKNCTKNFKINSPRCGIFGFCLLSFPQNERKLYKIRQLSLCQFVYFWAQLEPSILKKVFCKSKHRWLYAQKNTNRDKLGCLSLYIFLSFWGNERRQKTSIPHPYLCFGTFNLFLQGSWCSAQTTHKLQGVLALCEFHYCKFHCCGFSKLLLKFC